MIRRDLITGHWRPYLERAISLKPCYDTGINGGEVSSFSFINQLIGTYLLALITLPPFCYWN